ncbi:MAG: DUF2752 domain-containing protein [Anaeroplasmataceae bacterium]|nr:DUF2752 domain-containing protein [Anaeroplasmataceae bacterium]MDE6414761.1 DUF2752 domain-containing protein [Anaeroplasmataceae bacterium]
MKRAFQNIINFLIQFNIPICLFGLYVFITHAFGWQNCIIKLTIGYPCPGCGMSRAMFALLQFDFVKAFQYNPFVFALPIVGIAIAFQHVSIIKKILNNKWICLALIGMVFIVYILRFVYVYPKVPMDYYKYNLLSLIISIFK